MLKQLAAIGVGAALILAPVASFAQTDATATPAATAAPMAKKVVKHHTVKKAPAKHKAAKKPAPAPTETPKS